LVFAAPFLEFFSVIFILSFQKKFQYLAPGLISFGLLYCFEAILDQEIFELFSPRRS